MVSSGARAGPLGTCLRVQGAASSPSPLLPAHPQDGLFRCSPQARPIPPNGGSSLPNLPIFRHDALLSQVTAPSTPPRVPPPPFLSFPDPSARARTWPVRTVHQSGGHRQLHHVDASISARVLGPRGSWTLEPQSGKPPAGILEVGVEAAVGGGAR